MMKVSIEEFLTSTEFTLSGQNSSVADFDRQSSMENFEATAQSLNFHDEHHGHEDGLDTLLSDPEVLFNASNGGFDAFECLHGFSNADENTIGRRGLEDKVSNDLPLMSRYPNEGRVVDGLNTSMQSNTAADIHRNMIVNDHDYHSMDEIKEEEDEDDDLDSGINSSPLTGNRNGKNNIGSSSLRSGLRPRSATRKRCFSSSSVDDGDSDEDVKPPSKRQRKMSGTASIASSSKRTGGSNSKNAIAARENREKKKQYVQGLEESNEKLRRENKKIMSELEIKRQSIQQLTTEVSYLRGILANVDEISALIRSVRRTPGITSVTTSLGSNLRTRNRNAVGHLDNENVRPMGSSTSLSTSASQNTSTNPGVCFHLNNGTVSLEFCSQCARTSRRQGLK
jgi:hypothetical protein